MKSFLWKSGGAEAGEGGRGDGERGEAAIMAFLAGEDVILDRELFAFDIQATRAHVRGLERIGILDPKETTRLVAALDELRSEFEAGSFVLDDRYEDGHSAIEFYLTEKAGEVGAKVHTGRSRNDQVAVATRLYLKDRLRQLAGLNAAIAGSCLEQATRHRDLPMPGYTHLQRAVPSSVGLWMAAFTEAFTDNLQLALNALEVVDCSPLGTAAGYGVNLPLDRQGVASELGFARLQINPMYAQNSRGKFEMLALQAAQHALQDVRRLAWDLSLFTTSEFGFLRLPRQYTTGSSIMPNKANPDVVELLRGRVATLEAAIVEIQSLLSLPSGYQRDLQLTKAPLLRGFAAALQALAIVPGLIDGLSFDEDRMQAAISVEMFATDRALEQAAHGVPFRAAYLEAKQSLESTDRPDAAASLAQRVSPGACGELLLERIRERLETIVGGFEESA